VDRNVRLPVVYCSVLAACGFGASVSPDAPPADAPPDMVTSFAACHEFDVAPLTVPAHVTSALAGADVQSPSMCATTDAPYGIESAGPDTVVLLTNLQVGMSYVVHLQSDADLAFYVVTGCSTPSGPAKDQCLLFEDASTGTDEVGRFVAPAASVYVVVDYYASHAPPEGGNFTLDVYPETCTTNAQCAGGSPVCANGTCVECATSFDCTNPAAPRCETAHDTCQPGIDQCLVDDPAEPDDDGPAGATVLVPDASGDAAHTAQICAAPLTERDYFAFDVTTLGEVWDFTLAWSGPRDLDLEAADATGKILGLSFWEHPESIRLTYLAPGRYYLRVREFSSSPDMTAVTYSIYAHRQLGTGCTSAADCAGEYRNQVYRGDCVAGSCVAIDGAAAVSEGGACDSQSDCAAGLDCPSFFFVANSDTRDVCARTCANDAECAPLGPSYVCTSYLQQNFCVQKCTTDEQCPTAIGTQPPTGPWYRLSCSVSTGHCLP
jgi:hypothetical protein